MLINADVGEGLLTDTQLFPFLDQASIACGGHTGDQHSMKKAVIACINHNVMIGAHPSYPDKRNFGRSSVELPASDLNISLQQQIESLSSVCLSLGATLDYVKPHGALYNDMMRQDDLFNQVVTLIAEIPINLRLMVGAAISEAQQNMAQELGINIIKEAFGDRQYLADGQLAPRTEKNAVFNNVEKITAQVTNLQNGMVEVKSGRLIVINAESICIHGDNPVSVKAIKSLAQLLHN